MPKPCLKLCLFLTLAFALVHSATIEHLLDYHFVPNKVWDAGLCEGGIMRLQTHDP